MMRGESIPAYRPMKEQVETVDEEELKFERWWRDARLAPYWSNVEMRQARDIWFIARGTK
jgi:hypothetical protein